MIGYIWQPGHVCGWYTRGSAGRFKGAEAWGHDGRISARNRLFDDAQRLESPIPS